MLLPDEILKIGKKIIFDRPTKNDISKGFLDDIDEFLKNLAKEV